MNDLVFSCTPTLSADIIARAGVELQREDFLLRSRVGGEDVDLMVRPDGTYCDSLDRWSPEKHNLVIWNTVTVADESALKGPRGVICEEAEYSFVLIWNSRSKDAKTSSFRMEGIILPKETRSAGGRGRSFVFAHEFLPGEIKGTLTLSLLMFIKKPATTVGRWEFRLANVQGFKFQPAFWTKEYLFEKNVLNFPIIEIEDDSEPMWWVDIGALEDPMSDMFDKSNICVYVNKANPGFQALEKSKNDKAMWAFHVEIMSTAYYLLIEFLREKENGEELLKRIQADEVFEPNSIASVLSLFIKGAGMRIGRASKGKDFYREICIAMQARLGWEA